MPEPPVKAPQPEETAAPGTTQETAAPGASAGSGTASATNGTASAQGEPRRLQGLALLRSLSVVLTLAVTASAFGAGWRVGSDSRPASAVPPVIEPKAPQWIAEFARAFCAGDAASVAAQVAAETGATEEGVSAAFARWEWQCDHVRYLGSSVGKQQAAYIFVMRSGAGGPETWWSFTTENEKVVRID